uniref:SJCHGC04341 protein n=1 Tax=Schistosoma japonicum TaxID=6182 RepID=Q5BSG8_SCHJA|nr:SJCHGC04341 protein [Schistosoma japonicum]
MDNNVRLILPNGWSERRSGLGRSYYTCDSSRRSTWNHPLVGPYIPLGWERVDSIKQVFTIKFTYSSLSTLPSHLLDYAPLKIPE